MKRLLSVLLCVIIVIFCFTFDISAIEEVMSPVIDFNLSSNEDVVATEGELQTRATGLILSYSLGISRNGNTLTITGTTNCNPDVVKCGFKNLTVERRLNSSSSWEDYYEYGNKYLDAASANISTSLTVESGYQYRVTTKHYAKKSLLVTQTISNESNYLTF